MSRWWAHGSLVAVETFFLGVSYAAVTYGALSILWLPQVLMLQIALSTLVILLWRFYGVLRVIAIHLASLVAATLIVLGLLHVPELLLLLPAT
jgi:hypothetical protein